VLLFLLDSARAVAMAMAPASSCGGDDDDYD